MTIEEAAKLLQARLQEFPWLTAVGVGEAEGTPCIVVYVKSRKDAKVDFLRDGWEGFPVVVRKMGSPRLVATYWPRGVPKLRESENVLSRNRYSCLSASSGPETICLKIGRPYPSLSSWMIW